MIPTPPIAMLPTSGKAGVLVIGLLIALALFAPHKADQSQKPTKQPL